MRFLTLTMVFITLSAMAGASCGTVFLEGDVVRVPNPGSDNAVKGVWRALDDRFEEVRSGVWPSDVAEVEIGALPVGWYWIGFFDASEDLADFTTAAVLVPPAKKVRPDSPVALDIALSWVPEADLEVQRRCVALARMAGVPMVRDRLRWRELQDASGQFFPKTKYDETAALQHEAGLQILQVFHQTPEWVWEEDEDRGRIPRDLRATWRFCQGVAGRFRGVVQAWQPWNEGNSANFGGHTIDELCSHQKAAYFGFRAGNPDATVCWAPLGGINSEALCKGVTDNGTAAYFDVYTMHCYDWPHDYARLRQWALTAAAGKPLWVTECDRGLSADPASPLGDLTRENERRKAEFIPQSITSSLAAGASRHFHFILPQYMEQDRRIQFGLLRHDQTPRMGYVSFAVAARLLSGAHPLGRLSLDGGSPDVFGFAFRAWPDGVAHDVLVVWAEAPVDWPERGRTKSAFHLPEGISVSAVYDFLGRSLSASVPEEIGGAPLYILLPEGAAATLPLQAISSPTPPAMEEPSPMVLQLYTPDMTIRGRILNWAHEHDRNAMPGDHEIAIYAYNFGEKAVSGTIRTTSLPSGWQCEPASWEVTVQPMERCRQEVRLHITEPLSSDDSENWIYFEGDMGTTSGKARLAARILTMTESDT